MAVKKNTNNNDAEGKKPAVKKPKEEPKRQRNRAGADKEGVRLPEAKYLDEFFEEFVVLAKPLAVWSKPDGAMSIVNSFEEVITTTLYGRIYPEMTPLTFRLPTEVERFARVTVTGQQLHVVIGNHLEQFVVKRRPENPKKKTSALDEAEPLEDADAPTAVFHWLNRQDMPSWVALQKIEPAGPGSPCS